MPAIAGRKTVVKVGASATGPWVVVKGINQASVKIGATMVDVSEFGPDWKNSLRGLLDAPITLSGNYRPDDTTGQVVIRDGYIADTDLWLQILPDGTAGFQQQTQINDFSVDTAVDSQAKLSIAGAQTGGVTFI